ncbi:MAG: Hsp20/alpha crystallin family protein [Desulfobacterales bacterium]|nr:Hsp20/alpha crystallin family protein [Desulfobacterales bacterium]
MQLVRRSPGADLFGLQNHMNRLFNEFFLPEDRDKEGLSAVAWHPTVDIYEKEDKIVIKAELPGVDKKNITVDVEHGVLTLKGEKTVDKEEKDETYHRRERFYGTFQRSFTLPAEADPNKIAAEYKDGVLTITVEKPEEKKPRKIAVK